MITIIDKNSIIVLHTQGISNRQIALKLGVSKDTVNKYVKEYVCHKKEISNEINENKIALFKKKCAPHQKEKVPQEKH